MTSWEGSYTFFIAPLAAFGLVGVLALLLRWTFSHGHSVVARRPTSGPVESYGLLVPAAEPGTFIEAEMMAAALRDAGVRVTLAPTDAGPRVMVFPEDLVRAHEVLGR